jgi:hypothetical protein
MIAAIAGAAIMAAARTAAERRTNMVHVWYVIWGLG